MPKKEAVLITNKIVETEYSDVSESVKDTSSEDEAIQRMRVSVEQLKDSQEPLMRFLGKSIESQLEELIKSTKTIQKDSK